MSSSSDGRQGATPRAAGTDESDHTTAEQNVATAEPRTVTVDERSVSYATYGDPNGAPVVFFHGTPGSRLLGTLYDDAARTRGVRILAFDRPGYGESASRPAYEPVDSAAVVAAILDDAGEERAGLVAFSGGTPHALATASDRPALVRGVEVVSGAVPATHRASTPTPQRVLGGLAATTPRLFSGLIRGQALAARHLPPSFVAAQYTTADGLDDLPDAVAEAAKRDFLEAVGSTRAGLLRESRQFTGDWSLSPSSVGCPVRWWHGEQDTNSPLAGVERFADALPDCELRVVPDADHLGALAATRKSVLARFAEDA